MQTPIPGGNLRTVNVGVESWLKTTYQETTPDTAERTPGIPEEFDEDITLDPALSYISVWDERQTRQYPLVSIRLDQQTMFVTFDVSLWDARDQETNQLVLPSGAEVWLCLNPANTWPSFWNGNIRPKAAGVIVGGPYA